MNYRTMVKGALAFSLSLIVGAASAANVDVPKYGATFETTTAVGTNDELGSAYAENQRIGQYNTGDNGYGWYAAADDESIITNLGNAVQGNVLQLNTDSYTLTNRFSSTVADELNDAIDGTTPNTDGAFFETKVKFVASDDPKAGIEGNQDATKFAIFAYKDDSGENAENNPVNLVVFHAVMDYEGSGVVTFTNEVFENVIIDPTAYSTLRINMKRLADPDIANKFYNVFSVTIDGTTIASKTALDAAFNGTETGIWFKTVEESSDDNNKKVSSLNFKGTGEIDDISVGVIEKQADDATVIFLAADGTELQNSAWPINANPSYTNAAPTKAADAAGVYTFAGWTNAATASVLYAPTDVLPAVVAGGATYTYTAVFASAPALASVDGTYYATLAEAVAAAIAAGGASPVVLNRDVALNDWILIDGAVTIDLAGHTISKGDNWSTATPAHDALIAVLHGGSLTLNDSSDPSTGMIDGSALTCGIKMTIAGDTNDTNPATLVVNGGTVKGKNFGISGNGLAGRGNTAITINGGTILGTDATSDSCGIFHPQAGTLTINGGHIEGGQGIWMKSGTCTCTVNAGEIVGNGPQGTYVSSGNGSGKTGDAFVVDNVGYPGGAPAPSILGGTFVSSNANAVASYSNAANEPIDSFVAGGTFNTPVPADLCADGYEPDSWEEDGVTYYGVKPASPATVITVACVNGATYTEADGVYTFAPPSADYTVSSVFTNGVNANTTTSLDLSAAEGEIKVVVAATKTRTAPTHKWYENPGVVGNTSYGIGSASLYYGPYNMDVDGDFITVPTWTSTSACLELYSRDAIDAGNAAYLAKFARTNYGYAMMGSGLSVPLNVAIAGANSGPYVVAFPLNNPNPVLGQDAFVISNSLNATLIQFKFTDDAQYVYARPYDGTKVYKFKVLNGLKTTGVNLVEPVTYDFGQRVRSFELAQIGGKDIVYALLENKTISVVDTSVETPTATPLISDEALSKYVNISVSGIADGTPHLTIASCNHANNVVRSRVDVYTLTAAGTAVDTSVETISFDTAAVTAWGIPTANHNADGCDAVVVDDEGTLYLGYGSAVYAIQYVAPPTYDITASVTAGTIATNGSAAVAGTYALLEGDTVVFTADTGATLKSVTIDGEPLENVDTAATSYTFTVGTDDATVAVVFEASAPAGYNYPEGGAIEDADVVAWLTNKGFTQAQVTALGTNAKLNECYLLNCDISQTGAGGTITITAITVGSDVKVTVSLDRTGGYEGGINGTLKLYGTADLATAPKLLGTATFDDAKFASGTTATATFTGTTEKFFKAVIE